MKAAYLEKIFFLLILSLTSCVQPVYIPNKIQTPMFKEKGQFFANAATETNSGTGGALAYSPLSNTYLEIGGNINPSIKPFESNFKTWFAYGAIGTYGWLSSHFIVEGEAGFGRGSTETYDKLSTFVPDSIPHGEFQPNGHYITECDHTNASYNRFHIQGSFGYHLGVSENENSWKNLIFEAALTPRITFLNTTKYNVDHYDSTKAFISTLEKGYSNIFLEYGVTIRFGFEHLMLELQSLSILPIGSAKLLIPNSGAALSIALVSRF